MSTKAKPAAGNGGHRTITVSNWKPLQQSGSLRGFLTLTLPSGLIIHNCQLLEAGSKRWVGLPARVPQLQKPVWDGNVISKSIRDQLRDKGLIDRPADRDDLRIRRA
jgi:hypothetical protein